MYGEPVTWPGRNGRPPRHGIPVTCHNEPAAAKPEPDESLLLPDTSHYGTVRAGAWHPVHPVVHGDRGWFRDNWHGELPVLRGTLLRVIVERLPGGRTPHKTMWLWHASPAPLSPDELWRAYLARVRHSMPSGSSRAASGSPPPRSAPPPRPSGGSAWSLGHHAQLLLARPLAIDLRRPWEKPPGLGRPVTAGRVRRGFPNIRRQIGTPRTCRQTRTTRPRTA
jgi:hypothetical protein